ncbi:MAG: hypothetical protein ACLTFV_08370 [[Clostridium] innocuum]
MNSKHRVHNFWSYFLTIQQPLETALREQDRHEYEHLLNDINEQLKTVCGCKLEVEMSETGFFEMTFATGGDKTAQLCSALLKKDAPQQLSENWIINAFRPPLSERALNSYLQLNGQTVRGADFKVYYTIEEESKTVELKVYCAALQGLEETNKESIVAYMLELFIGELEFEARISRVEILDAEIDEENVCLLPNLYEDLCDIIIDQEWMEYHDPLSIYMAYKLDEKPVSETLRRDMKLIVTTNPQLQEEVLNKEYATCKDFADKGGEYGYLYYEKLYEDEKEALVRQQLEKEINDLLYPMSVARTMGGAIGMYYSYIDLAVFDRDGFAIALEKINEKMKFKIYYHSFLED